MNRSVSGFILLVSLALMMVISLLVLSHLQQILMYSKGVGSRIHQHQELYQLERAAHSLSKLIPNSINGNCIKDSNSPNRIITLLIKGQGCRIESKGTHLNYLIEDIGRKDCIGVLVDNTVMSSHSYRVTILNFKGRLASSALQILFAKPEKQFYCEALRGMTTLGMNSWRYLVIE